ncbi:MBL fold metallo-hydrolase [Occultella gossypii]|uniref:MBL fold metallo-hydrolase n=1 Tax=Occultella gossypii TaxID=2800820 RepID=A0ABS7SD93_9MICO|nr:MBL fold metallo-hydrolase [Occultella gossypii]MBZ2198333.1 MBL fold metallo-hydrolase [Occultella gossypii]
MPADLRAYACGHTHHDIGGLVRGARRERRTFPSNVFCYTDTGRRILYDTGYAPPPWRTGLAGRAYRRLLPPVIGPGADVAAQIDPAGVTHVVLSHLHPDHIGGLVHFPHATLVLHPALLATLARPRLTDGVLPGLLPDWFDHARRIVVGEFTPGPFGLATYDLFGDDSYHLVDLPGHARGHLGALVAGRTLLAGDAAWGRDLLDQVDRMRTLPRLITADGAAHRRTARHLLEAERRGARLLFSHDAHPTGVDLL